MDTHETKEKTDNLAKALLKMKPSLGFKQKNAIKNRLLSKLEVPASERFPALLQAVVEAIRRAVAGIKLSTTSRASLKEKIFGMLENRVQERFFWSNLFAFHKKLVGSVVIFVLIFGLFSFVNVETGVVRAATFTTLDSFGGGILLERNGQFVDVHPGMQVFEGDAIITAADGEAVVKYFDDSLTRMTANTHVIVNALNKPDGTSVSSYVEVSLVAGQLWSRVVNLVGPQSSFVVEADDVYMVAKKAAFNLALQDRKLEIGVFNHAVNVSAGGATERVLSGEKMVVTDKAKRVTKIAKTEKNLPWVKENLENDKEYVTEVEKKLLLAKMEVLGIELDDDFSFENSLREETLLLLTFDDVKKRKTELDLAEKKFFAAQVKLHDPDLNEEERTEAGAAVDDFARVVEKFNNFVKEVSYTDENFAQELRNHLKDKISASKKDLIVTSPDSPLYDLKKVVGNLELLTASDAGEAAEIKAEQAKEKLVIAEDIKDSGDYERASGFLAEYKEEIGGVIEMIDSLDPEAGEAGLVEEVNYDLQLMVAIESDVRELQHGQVPYSPPVSGLSEVIDTTAGSEEDVTTVEPEPVVEGPYGVTIQGDKPLSPFFK